MLRILVCINGRKLGWLVREMVGGRGGVKELVDRAVGAGEGRKHCCDNSDQIVNDNVNASSVIILLNRFVIPLPATNNIYPTVRFYNISCLTLIGLYSATIETIDF